MKRVLIYGTGMCAEYIIGHHEFVDEKIIAALESEREHKTWNGVEVYGIKDIERLDFDEIWLVNSFFETLNNCISLGIPKEKLVIWNDLLYRDYCKRSPVIDIKYMKKEAEAYEVYVRGRSGKIITVTMDRYDQAPGMRVNADGILEHGDYFRYMMLQLLMEEVKERRLDGALAELGVFRADFSRWMNESFPDKELYLFDTFESFLDSDVEAESNNDYTPQVLIDTYKDMFQNTSVEYVLSRMKYPEKCKIRKGYFPETVPDEEINFSLVSLDCDLYVPTLAGLKYFYPRLEEGGFIIIHDYNHEDHWLGVKEAVKEYEQEIGHIVKVPLADNCGSLVISK